MKRYELIKYVVDNGGKENCGSTWEELLGMFDIETNYNNIKRASDWYRYYKQTGNLVPDSYFDENISEEIITDSPKPPVKGLTIKSAWQNAAGDWLYSYKSDNDVNIDELKNELVTSIQDYIPKEFKLKEVTSEQNNLYVLSIPDLHFGKEPLENTYNKLNTVLSDLLSRINTPNNQIVFVTGNDLLNSDTVDYTTTKGTPQFDYVPWKESFTFTWQTMVEAILKISEKGKVEVINVQGNHDYIKSYALGDVLKAYFTNTDVIEINNSKDDRKYFQFGSNLFMFEHGELKPQQYPLLMATEKPLEWGKSKFKTVFCGHLHHEIVKDFNGVKVRYLPSIGSDDNWHKKQGYVGAVKSAQMYHYKKESGLYCIHEISI